MVGTKTKSRAKAPASSGKTKRIALSESAQKKTKICPKCSKRKDVKTGFGLRNMGGVLRPQARCYACRSNTKFRKEATPRGVEYEFVVEDEPKQKPKRKVKRLGSGEMEITDSDHAMFARQDAEAAGEDGDKAFAEALAEDNKDVLTTDRADTARLYAKHFPNDTQSRGWKVRAQRLVKKLGSSLLIEADAADQLESKSGECPV